MQYHKKCLPNLFEDVRTGKKRFEVRLADFEVQVGDQIVLEEWDPEAQAYTGRTFSVDVEYILKTKDMPAWTEDKIAEYGFQIMQIKPSTDSV